MTREEAKKVFLDRGYVNGVFDGDKWRQSIVVISNWLEQEPFINKPCVSKDVCEHDKNVTLDKIIAEIEELPKTYPFINHIDIYVKEDDVKAIIDKYKAESEDMDEGYN